jgi:hypothetical protein
MRVRMVLAAAAALVAVAMSPLAAEVTPAQAAQEQAPELKQVQGTVRGVKPLERTIEVDGHAGLFPKRVVVEPGTVVILPDGSRGSLAAICEGDRVEASYREVGDENVAESVRLLESRREPAAGCPRP